MDRRSEQNRMCLFPLWTEVNCEVCSAIIGDLRKKQKMEVETKKYESYSIFNQKVKRVKEKEIKHELLPPVKGFISIAQAPKDLSASGASWTSEHRDSCGQKSKIQFMTRLQYIREA